MAAHLGLSRSSGVADDAAHLAGLIVTAGQAGTTKTADVHWIAETPPRTYPDGDEWTAPRTVA